MIDVVGTTGQVLGNIGKKIIFFPERWEFLCNGSNIHRSSFSTSTKVYVRDIVVLTGNVIAERL